MHLLFHFDLLATTQMIRTHSLAFGSDYVKLNWTQPNFLPEIYELNYMCSMRSTCTPNFAMNNSVTTSAQNLSSETTSVTVSDLCPSSICMLFLLAVYNPASIDSGIWIRGTTLREGGSEGNLYYVFSDFMIKNLSSIICLL